MKKLWKRFRDWLIRKLGGFTQQEVAEAIDDWTDRMNAAEDHIARLELERNVAQKKNVELTKENGRLKMELDRNPPAWKMLGDIETLVPRTLQAEMVIRRDAYEITNPVPRAKEHLARQIFNGILPLIHYHFENDFAGNSRVIATLRVLTGPGVAE